jgi:hypothetical protein
MADNATPNAAKDTRPMAFQVQLKPGAGTRMSWSLGKQGQLLKANPAHS